MRYIFLTIFCLLFAGSLFAQSQAPTAVEELYLAKDNGEGKAGEQSLEFGTSDIPIYCVVLLDSSAKTTVKMNFVAVSVAGVKPDTKVVTASYTTSGNQNRVNFSGHPDGKWTPGRYRVDLFLDGKPAKTLEFSIKATPTAGGAGGLFPKQEAAKRKVRHAPRRDEP